MLFIFQCKLITELQFLNVHVNTSYVSTKSKLRYFVALCLLDGKAKKKNKKKQNKKKQNKKKQNNKTDYCSTHMHCRHRDSAIVVQEAPLE